LERRDPAGGGSWTDADASGPLAEDGVVTLKDTTPSPGSGIYRVKVVLP
jgi:hypothetical protein